MAKQAPVKWAQREDVIYLTIDLSDISDEEITLETNKLTFKGKSHGEDYHVEVEFHAEVDPANSKRRVNAHDAFFSIQKKESGPYWPRLTKEKQKYHWLKVDFNKWKDEDDDEEDDTPEPDMGGMQNFDMSSMLSQMGGPGGMQGMQGLGDLAGLGGEGAPDLGGDDDEEDSDDEEIPDLE